MVNTHYPPPPTESRGRPGRFHMPLSPGDLHGNGPPLHDCPNPFNTASPPGHYHSPSRSPGAPRTISDAAFARRFAWQCTLEDSRGFWRILNESIEETINTLMFLTTTHISHFSSMQPPWGPPGDPMGGPWGPPWGPHGDPLRKPSKTLMFYCIRQHLTHLLLKYF